MTLSFLGHAMTSDSTTIKNVRDTLDIRIAKPIKFDSGQSIHVDLDTEDEKDWTDYFSAILTPIVAVLAIWIAYRQYDTQQYQVRLDLFERRIKIIEDVRTVLTDIDKHYSGDPKNVNLELFRVAYRHSMYLFSTDIQTYLKGIDSRIGSLEGIELELKKESSDKETLNKQKDVIIVWLREQRPGHEKKFEKFMTLNKI